MMASHRGPQYYSKLRFCFFLLKCSCKRKPIYGRIKIPNNKSPGMLSAVIISVGGLFQVIREVVRRGVSCSVAIYKIWGGYVKCFLLFFVKNNESSCRRKASFATQLHNLSENELIPQMPSLRIAFISALVRRKLSRNPAAIRSFCFAQASGGKHYTGCSTAREGSGCRMG